MRGEIAKVAAFLDKSLTEEELDKLTEHLKFDNFEKNESVNNESGKKFGLMNPDGKFIRKGTKNNAINYIWLYYITAQLLQVKLEIGKIISVRN